MDLTRRKAHPNAICLAVCGLRSRATGTKKRKKQKAGLDFRSMHPRADWLGQQCDSNANRTLFSLALRLLQALVRLDCLLHFRARISNRDVESKQPTRILSASLPRQPATHGPRSRLSSGAHLRCSRSPQAPPSEWLGAQSDLAEFCFEARSQLRKGKAESGLVGLIECAECAVQRRVAAISLTPHLLGVHGWLGKMQMQIQSQSQNQNFRCFFFCREGAWRESAGGRECPILVQF